MTDVAAPDVVLTASRTIAIDDPARAWLVISGRVLVFAVDAAGEDHVDRRPRALVLEAGDGELVGGVDAAGCDRTWVMAGLGRAELRSTSMVDLLEAAATSGSIERGQLELWLERLGADDGTGATALAATDGPAALAQQTRRAVLDEAARCEQRGVVAAAHMQTTEAHTAAATENAVDALASIFDWKRFRDAKLGAHEDDLLAACRLVGDRLGVRVAAPTAEDLRRADPLTAIARASKVRFREVTLEDRWWQHGGVALVGRRLDGRPVALLPHRRGYELVDPATDDPRLVTASVAAELDRTAISLVRPITPTTTTLRSLASVALRDQRVDGVRLLVCAVLVGLLGLIPPLATRTVFAEIVPRADYGRLAALTAGLVGVAIASVLFEVVRGAALLRTRGRADDATQLALWDRLLRLPPTFFRRYQVGDLVERSMVVSTVGEQVNDRVVILMLAGAFGSFNLIAMFVISPQLALVGVALCLVGGVAIYLARRAYQGPQLEMLAGRRALAGEVLQYLNGIVKIRTSGAERRVFARWAKAYAEQNAQVMRTIRIDNTRIVFETSFRTVAMLVLFAVVALLGQDDVDPASFMAFYLAFGLLLQSIFQFSTSWVAVLEGAPTLEQARPILDTPTEADGGGEHPGPLQGRIEVRNVRFRYPGAPRDLFEDVSLTIEPGEFVAVVGPSGSGKSTLLRLLLGFDELDAGSIAYDGKDLAGLDIDAVRQQLGVVLQQTALLPGSLRQNIAGAAELSDDEIWRAAQQAAMDRDIEQLPDGLDTEIGDGVGVLSGGQQQRLQIARALASRPRLLFLDEATSALDNLTQEVVSRTVSEMPITRVVIAHRLSTIASADRVVLIADGRVAQDGPFDELAATPGPFADLIARQQL